MQSPITERDGPIDAARHPATPVRRHSLIPPPRRADRAERRGIDFRPAYLTRRQTATWDGVSGEVVRILDHAPFESEYAGPRHLLIAYERAVREQGESILEGLPRSRQHDFSHRMTFIPAGRKFFESQQPRGPTRAIYVYLDPCLAHRERDGRVESVELKPRLFFDSPLLWQTLLKLKELIELGASARRDYAEALGVVLAHELLQLSSGAVSAEPAARGGLAGWQRRIVAQYLEENLTEPVALSTLAGLVRLSPYHFARAFKQSFGVPPHRYHTYQRIERAKTLLAKPALSITEIAFAVGFREASTFTTAFRRCARRTPTEYRRSLL
jgi:AraC family transcriptional regulator